MTTLKDLETVRECLVRIAYGAYYKADPSNSLALLDQLIEREKKRESLAETLVRELETLVNSPTNRWVWLEEVIAIVNKTGANEIHTKQEPIAESLLRELDKLFAMKRHDEWWIKLDDAIAIVNKHLGRKT